MPEHTYEDYQLPESEHDAIEMSEEFHTFLGEVADSFEDSVDDSWFGIENQYEPEETISFSEEDFK